MGSERVREVIPPNKEHVLPPGLTMERACSVTELIQLPQAEMGTIGRMIIGHDGTWKDCVKLVQSPIIRKGIQQLAFVDQEEPSRMNGTVRVIGIGIVPVGELDVPTKEEVETWFQGNFTWTE